MTISAGSSRSFRFAAAALVFVGAAGLAGAQPRESPRPAPKSELPARGEGAAGAKSKAADNKDFKTADELLTALETADKKIKTISAELNFTTKAADLEGGDTQLRHGWLYFRNRSEAKGDDAKPAPAAETAACVRFDYLIQSRKQYPERKTYVVNGSEIIERIENEKLVNRYLIGKKDQDHNPLQLGQGPFPLPFGQKKEEVLARFEPDLRPALEGLEMISTGLKERLSPTYQLKLVPKSNAGVSSKVKEVRVWYQKSDLLPVLARIIRPDGGFDEFYLVGIQVNKDLPQDIFDTKVPDGWKLEEKQRP